MSYKFEHRNLRFTPGGFDELIALDRYAVTSTDPKDLAVGDTVVFIDDPAKGSRRVGVIADLMPDIGEALVKDRDGNAFNVTLEHIVKPLETTPAEFWSRWAYGAASVEAEPRRGVAQDPFYLDTLEKWRAEFSWLFDGYRYSPGGRIQLGLGHEYLGRDKANLTLVNCFVGPKVECGEIEVTRGRATIDPVDQWRKVLDNLRNQIEVQRRGGGYGVNITDIATVRGGVKSRVSLFLSDTHKDHAEIEGLVSLGKFDGVDGVGRTVLPRPGLDHVILVDDSIDGIMSALIEMVTKLYEGHDVVVSFGALRPRHAPVANIGRSSGAASWMTLFALAVRLLRQETIDAVDFAELFAFTTNLVEQGGSRRGALMLVYNVDGPVVEKFITRKREPGRLVGANVSVGVSDEFMASVKFYEVCADDHADYEPLAEATVEASEAHRIWRLIVESAHASAEPGVIFLERYNKESNSWYYAPIEATNPCWTGNTQVWTIYGPKTFVELAETGDDVPVLSQDDNGRMIFKMMRNPRLTRRNASLVKIVLDDGTELTCTPDHNVYLKSGEKIHAEDIRPGDSLASCYRYKANSKGYLRLTNGVEQPLEHHVVAEWNVGRRPDYPSEHTHHIDGVKTNNAPENIEVMPASKHNALNMFGKDNPMSGVWDERNPLFGKSVEGSSNPRYRHDVSDETIAMLRSRGMSYESIAKMVGCSEYTVARRLGYVRRGSREAVANHKVVSVEHLTDTADVYNGTVDDTHRYFVMCGENDAILSANCGEQGLPANGACNLGHLVLPRFVIGDWAKKSRMGGTVAYIDWESLERATRLAVRFQDDCIDYSYYPTPATKAQQAKERRVGIGTMGLGTMLIMLGLRYGSDEAIGFIDDLYANIAYWAYDESINLAHEKGAFPAFIHEKDVQSGFVRRLFDRFPDLEAKQAKFGRRNVTLLTQAPTGTTGSLLSQVLGKNGVTPGTSTGIEPYYAFGYERTSRAGTFWIEEDVSAQYRQANGLGPDDALPDYFVTSMDLAPSEHVRVQATIQRWVDSSISKTINMPSDATVDDAMQAYMLAYDEGCKGVTIYVDGSRQAQVLSTERGGSKLEAHIEAEAMREIDDDRPVDENTKWATLAEFDAAMEANAPKPSFPKRPRRSFGFTEKIKVPIGNERLGKVYVTINVDETGAPYEVFLNANDEEIADIAQSLGRMVTQILRYGGTSDNVDQAIKHLRRGQTNMFSLPSQLARLIEEVAYKGVEFPAPYSVERGHVDDDRLINAIWDELTNNVDVKHEDIAKIVKAYTRPLGESAKVVVPVEVGKTMHAPTKPKRKLAKCAECGEMEYDKSACTCRACGASKCS